MQLTPFKFLSQIALLLKLLCCSLITQTKAIECTVIKTVTGDELILETAGAQQFTVFLNNIDAPEIGQEYCETSKSMVHRFVMDKKLSVTRIAHSGHPVKNGSLTTLYGTDHCIRIKCPRNKCC
jgi:endonuclease YncB( thermonuclease family)